MKKILLVIGVRPNIVKAAPLVDQINKKRGLKCVLVHTGQHYDRRLSQLLLDELGMSRPDYNLGAGSGSHAQQTAKIMQLFEPVVLKEKPDFVLVFGDVNSSLACALVAAKLNIPVTHVEAGLRCFNRRMAEEVNRVLIDHLSDCLFTTEKRGSENLKNEGISPDKIFLVGNVMVDTLKKNLKRIKEIKILEKFNLEPKGYALLTLHRASNVDAPKAFLEILEILEELGKRIKIVFPIHPRTEKRIKKFGFKKRIKRIKNLLIIPPQGYLEFIKLMKEAKLVMTDSGGAQEEAAVLGIPCLVVRGLTERTSLIDKHSNILAGRNKRLIVRTVDKVLSDKVKPRGCRNKLWEGNSSQRIVEILAQKMKAQTQE